MFNAWNYAGLKNKKKALTELDKLKKEESFMPVYHQQRAMLLDFMGDNREAQKEYDIVMKDRDNDLSVRLLEIIANFYVRSGQKERAQAMMVSTMSHPALEALLAVLRSRVFSEDEKNTQPILSSVRIGAAEAMFAVVSSFKYAEAIDVAHMYTALTIYLNPNYSTAKIMMADIFEAREMYDNANKIYDSIDKNDVGYYPAQIKKARNLVKMENYEAAEILLKSLSEDYDDMQIYMELGDMLRLSGRFVEAVEAYDNAIKRTKNPTNLWVLYYAKGIALERSGQWKEAEKVLFKAYAINKHYLVLNYIGYTWLLQKHNVEKALAFIIDAYNQAPDDASINDSLGFALYNLGYYDKALIYLERAVDMYPSSAIMSSHLGDAYWFAGRKNEAKFQWQHALTLKDDSGELDVKLTKLKIKKGIIEEPKLLYNSKHVDKLLKKIKAFSGSTINKI